jgi:hypothetical protein
MEYAKLGYFFLTILASYSHNLIERELIESEESNYFEPAGIIINEKYIEEIKENIIVPPTTLPMVCKPNI